MDIQDEKYFECYKVIYNSLVSAYKDIYTIEAIWELVKANSNLPKSVNVVLLHIRELALSDLCSVLWKISIDNDQKAATIDRLKNIVKQYDKNYITNKKYSPSAGNIKKSIENLRNSHISHADQIQPKESIKIETLFIRANEVREMLNDMCYPNLDYRVEELDDSKINVINYHIKNGLVFMVEGSIQLTYSPETIGDDHAE